MGLFSKRDKNTYDAYTSEFSDENYTLSDEGIIPVGKRQDINAAPHALTADEVKGNEPVKPVVDIPMQSAGESLYERMLSARKENDNHTEANKKSEEVKVQAESLLSKCSQFVNDGKTETVPVSKPVYTLDSIESIIAEAERKAQERVKKIYGNDVSATAVPPKTEPVKATASPIENEAVKETNVPFKVEIKHHELDVTEPEIEQPKKEEPAPASTATDATIEIGLPGEPELIHMEREVAIKNYQYRFADEDLEGNTSTAEENTIAFPSVEPESDIDTTLAMALKAFEEDELGYAEDEEEIYNDYETVADAATIAAELRSKKSHITIRLVFAIIFAAVLTALALPFSDEIKIGNERIFLILETLFTALSAIIGFDVFKSFGSLLDRKANSDLPAAVCITVALIHGVLCIANPNVNYAQFGFIAAIGIMFSLIGKNNDAARILKNFETVANDEKKSAVTLIDESHGSAAIAHDAVEGEALIAAGRKTVNITRFLKSSYGDDVFAPRVSVLTAIGATVSVICAIYSFITADLLTAVYTLTAGLCVTAPFTSAVIGTLPMRLAGKRLNRYGAMLSGADAVEVTEQVNAVAFDIQSIFPRGTVKMFDMKILSPNNLEQTIFNAAAVTTFINSPLGHVFRRIARTSEDYVLPPADSVKYENRLGISGWVGDHSLLIGNRTLMETHGVPVPSVEVDKKILRNGYFPVYVASDGRPCALLIVGYEPDAEIATELHRLCATGVTLLVNNCDPNINEEMLCDYFGLDAEFVKLMPAGSARRHHEATEYTESVPAGAAYSGNAEGLASIVTAAIKIKKLTTAMTVLHIICFVAGLAALAVTVFGAMPAFLTPQNTVLYLIASAFIVYLAPLFLKP